MEAVHLTATRDGYRWDGRTIGIEDGVARALDYAITVDRAWRTRSATLNLRSPVGVRTCAIQRDDDSGWLVDGRAIAGLDDCLDIDLEWSACTNTLALHRLDPAIDVLTPACALYVRADLSIERLVQTYTRRASHGEEIPYDYRSPAFGTECRIRCDTAGLVIDYPEIARRVA